MPELQHLLGDMSAEEFLRDYWQKKPLLIRNALKHFVDPLSPEELAGLACEPDINSRMIIEKDADSPWQVSHGPFAEEDFINTPDTHWTLLVQDVNRIVPELACLLDFFRFVPDWRLDDIMVSYAPEHGSVGPHIDNYDVFLLQGMGRRRWQINTTQVSDDDLLPGLDLRILKNFQAEQEWLLESGDMLYLPPRVQHYGVATEDCLTYSIGFHAPERSELLGDLAGWLAQQEQNNPRYSDRDTSLPEHAGEIDAATLQRVRDLMGAYDISDAEFTKWFGSFATANGQASEIDKSFQECVPYWQQQGWLLRNPACRFAFSKASDDLLLFVNGQIHSLPHGAEQAVSLLCDRVNIPWTDIESQCHTPAIAELWRHWYDCGYLSEPYDDD